MPENDDSGTTAKDRKLVRALRLIHGDLKWIALTLGLLTILAFGSFFSWCWAFPTIARDFLEALRR